MLKQALRNPVVQYLLGTVIGGYMLLVGATTRWTRVNQAAIDPFLRGEGRMIGCIWHGRFMQVHKMWAFGPGIPKAKMLISNSREGGVVVHASRTVGAEVIRGSAAKQGGRRKGGVEALLSMARHLDHGGAICMTPDGPRGPRMRAKKAPVQLAKLAGARLVAVAWATKNRIVIKKSWDKFVFPLPFGRGVLVWSDPIDPPAEGASDGEIESVRAKLEAEMNRIAAQADQMAGVEAIDPAPVDAPSPQSSAADAETAAS